MSPQIPSSEVCDLPDAAGAVAGATGVFFSDGSVLSRDGTGVVDDATGTTWNLLGEAVRGPRQGARSIIDYVPWVALAIGVALAALGVAMLVFCVQLNVALPHVERGGSSRRYRSMFLFGISYAVASLSCALPVFLAVTGAASATPTFLSGCSPTWCTAWACPCC
jgi:hypothetical protein